MLTIEDIEIFKELMRLEVIKINFYNDTELYALTYEMILNNLCNITLTSPVDEYISALLKKISNPDTLNELIDVLKIEVR